MRNCSFTYLQFTFYSSVFFIGVAAYFTFKNSTVLTANFSRRLVTATLWILFVDGHSYITYWNRCGLVLKAINFRHAD